MTEPDYLTSREACDLCRYSRPDTFLRAFRALGFRVHKRGGEHGRCLVWRVDVERFLNGEDDHGHPMEWG